MTLPDVTDEEAIQDIECMAVDLIGQSLDDEEVLMAVLLACANNMGALCAADPDSPTEALEGHLKVYADLVRTTFEKCLRADDDEPFLTTLWPHRGPEYGALQ